MTQGKPPPQARLIEQRVASDVTKVRRSAGWSDGRCSRFSRSCIVSRRKLIRVFQVPGLIVMPIVFG